VANKKTKKKRASAPKLRVSFDTNVLYTDLAHHLLRREAKDLIESNSDHSDLKIEWYLSSVVTGEREYQMRRKAAQLYKSVEQLEKLLGHPLATSDIISDRIRRVISDQLRNLNIQLLDLEEENVDWNDIIRRSISRLPPFDPEVREKGFRDAAIAESFLQLASRSPKSVASCRLAFVSGDKLIRDYVEERAQDRQNVRVLENLDELEGLINTLVSKVPEDRIREWQEKAGHYFFEKEDESTWFYKKEIRKYLNEIYAEELADTPEGNYTRRQGTWLISAPVFIRKDRQRIHWMTKIEAKSKLFKTAESDTLSGGLLGSQSRAPKILGRALAVPMVTEEGSAVSVMEVHWSVSISAHRESLSKPKLDDTIFVDTEFELTRPSFNALASVLNKYQTDS